MRILFEHIMSTLAPVEQVVCSQWFVPEREGNAPARGQRIAFAIQGGLSDEFVKDTLQIDIAPIRKTLIRAVDNLSKHVHGASDFRKRVTQFFERCSAAVRAHSCHAGSNMSKFFRHGHNSPDGIHKTPFGASVTRPRLQAVIASPIE